RQPQPGRHMRHEARLAAARRPLEQQWQALAERVLEDLALVAGGLVIGNCRTCIRRAVSVKSLHAPPRHGEPLDIGSPTIIPPAPAQPPTAPACPRELAPARRRGTR